MTDPNAKPTGSRLTVRRLRAHYLVAADHPDPARVKSRLDDSITEGLSRTLGAAVAPALPETDTGVWLIRRLEVELDVNAAWEREALRRAFAVRFARELDRTLRDGLDGRDVVWFPDRAAYLASFLADRSDGLGSQWFYESFAGLRPLPLSAAIRTAVCDHPPTGLTALLRLAPDALRRVLRALTVQDARLILDVLAAVEPDGDPSRTLDAALAAFEGLPESSLDGDEARDSLRLYLASYEAGAASGQALRDAVRGLVRLSRILKSAPHGDHARVLGAMARGDQAEVERTIGSAGVEALAPFWPIARSAAEVLSRRVSPTGSEADARPGLIATPFGGAFFLLPILDELPLDDAVGGWPNVGPCPASSVVRFLILVKCLGSDNVSREFRDPLLRNLFGIDPDFSPETLFAWQAGLSARPRDGFLAVLEDAHVERGAIALGTQILARVVPTDRPPAAVLIDCARGVWRRLEKDTVGRADRTVRRLHSALALIHQGSLIIADPEFAGPLRAMASDQTVQTLTDPLPDDEAEARDSLPGSTGWRTIWSTWRCHQRWASRARSTGRSRWRRRG